MDRMEVSSSLLSPPPAHRQVAVDILLEVPGQRLLHLLQSVPRGGGAAAAGGDEGGDCGGGWDGGDCGGRCPAGGEGCIY